MHQSIGCIDAEMLNKEYEDLETEDGASRFPIPFCHGYFGIEPIGLSGLIVAQIYMFFCSKAMNH